MREAAEREVAAEAWRRIGEVLAAHVVMLRDASILDDAVAAALLSAMDGVTPGEPPPGVMLTELVGAYDERLDALTAAGAVGAGGVGRARGDVAATGARLALRNALLILTEATNGTRAALLTLADEHAFTLMPAYTGVQAVQPTTFAHFLGGVIAPLGRAIARAQASYAEVNRSPLGAAAVAATGLPIERERVADLLGFDAPVPSTYDAVAAVDYLADAVEVAAGIVAALRRFVAELLTWLRTEPNAFRLGESWVATSEPGLPQFRPPVGAERLVVEARRIEGDAVTVARLTHDAPYGPAGATLDVAFGQVLQVLTDAADVARRTTALVAELEVNRAYLANRAGRAHTTSGELTDLLVAEEGLDVAAARAITLMTVRKAMDQGIEASGVTPEMIDAAALLVVGRELGVEVERIGRALAPRRFLERRAVPGGPAPAATRAYLDQERLRLAADERWRTESRARLETAAKELDRVAVEILAQAG